MSIVEHVGYWLGIGICWFFLGLAHRDIQRLLKAIGILREACKDIETLRRARAAMLGKEVSELRAQSVR